MLDIKKIRKECAPILDIVFFPKKIISIKVFPRSQSGKIDRKALEQIAKIS